MKLGLSTHSDKSMEYNPAKPFKKICTVIIN